MTEIMSFKERLKSILNTGIEHTGKHAEDLRKLALEARTESMGVDKGLLEAAELAQALASKLREIAEKIK